jgi:uncharacterized protein YsxB (DUF464 family)
VVTVRIERAADGSIAGFVASGHAGAGRPGRDPVCAAVSALVQAAALGLERRLGIASAVVGAGPGYFACRLPSELPAEARRRAQDVLETMCLGLRAVARSARGRVRLEEGGP